MKEDCGNVQSYNFDVSNCDEMTSQAAASTIQSPVCGDRLSCCFVVQVQTPERGPDHDDKQ